MVLNDNLLFHTFTTNGYIAWAELYLEAIRYLYGSDAKVRIDCLNVNEENIKFLKSIHNHLDIRNNIKPDTEIAKELGITIDDYFGWRDEIETGDVNSLNFLYKIFISVNQRYRNIELVAQEAKKQGYSFLIHSDVDLYYRKRFDKLIDYMQDHDFAAFFRNTDAHNMKVLGAFLVFNLKQNSFAFIKEWMTQIDNVSFQNRWRGFGQSSLWFAVENTKNQIKILNLSNCKEIINYSKKFDSRSYIWLNSNSINLGHIKGLPRAISWEDLKQRFPRVEPFQKQNVSFKVNNKQELIVTYKITSNVDIS